MEGLFYDSDQTLMYLVIIFFSLMGFIAIVFVTSMDRKQKEKELEMKYRYLDSDKDKYKVPSKKVPKKQQNDEIIDSLNFMLAHGIIDTKEYNTLMVKCLPFMEGK